MWLNGVQGRKQLSLNNSQLKLRYDDLFITLLTFIYAASVSAMVLSNSFLDAIFLLKLSLILASFSVRIRMSFWTFLFSSSSSRICFWSSSLFVQRSSMPEIAIPNLHYYFTKLKICPRSRILILNTDFPMSGQQCLLSIGILKFII